MSRKLVVLDVVGLTPRCSRTCRASRRSPTTASRPELDTVLPAVTCTVQSTLPHRPAALGARHRRQRLVLPRARRGLLLAAAQRARAGREALGDGPARASRGYRAANLCWWYAMGATTDLTVTPRPVYHADGRKSPGLLHGPAGAARPS